MAPRRPNPIILDPIYTGEDLELQTVTVRLDGEPIEFPVGTTVAVEWRVDGVVQTTFAGDVGESAGQLTFDPAAGNTATSGLLQITMRYTVPGAGPRVGGILFCPIEPMP